MTQYLHTITLTDGERIAIEDALDMLQRKCRRRQHWAERECRDIRIKLARATPVMISTYVPYTRE